MAARKKKYESVSGKRMKKGATNVLTCDAATETTYTTGEALSATDQEDRHKSSQA